MKDFFYDFCGYNESIFLAVNHATQISFLPVVLKYISALFNITNFGVIYVILCIYHYIKIRDLSGESKKSQYHFIFNNFLYVGVCYAIFGFTFAALKFSFNLPRPFCSIPPDMFYSIMNFSSERCLSSFPSAHTGLSLLLSILLWPYLRNSFRILAVVVPILIAISRMNLAMHYPADLLYSVVAVIFVVNLSKIICAVFRNNLIKYVEDKLWKLFF